MKNTKATQLNCLYSIFILMIDFQLSGMGLVLVDPDNQVSCYSNYAKSCCTNCGWIQFSIIVDTKKCSSTKWLSHWQREVVYPESILARIMLVRSLTDCIVVHSDRFLSHKYCMWQRCCNYSIVSITCAVYMYRGL